jgi:5-methylcytosine-specific restriction endonuclease McrA
MRLLQKKRNKSAIRCGPPKRKSEYQLAKPKRTTTAKYKRTTDYEDDWPTASATRLKTAGYKCEYIVRGVRCGKKTYTVHHIISRSRGGTNRQSNLKAVCEACHALRHKHLR